MTTDEEKSKIAKLLQGLETPEIKLTERCSILVKEFHERFSEVVEGEEKTNMENRVYENPYKVDKYLLEENERKLRELLSENKRAKKETNDSLSTSEPDPKRPWRTHSTKEKLLRVDSDLKRHIEKSSQMISPMAEGDMQDLVKKCKEEAHAIPLVGADRLRDTVEAARKNLPNFQYRKIENTTATTILPDAHVLDIKTTPQNEEKR